MFSQQFTLQKAQETLVDVHRMMPIGSNNIRPLSLKNHYLVDTVTTAPELNSIQKKQQRQLEALLDIRLINLASKRIEQAKRIFEPYEEVINQQGLYYFLIARLAEQFGAGNCMKMVLLAMCLLYEKCPELAMNHVYFKNYDHDFLLLNLPPDAVIKDWRTWEGAVVMDPWLNVAYPAEEFLTFWKKKLSFLNKDDDAKHLDKEDSTIEYPGFLAIKSRIDDAKFFKIIKPFQSLFRDPKWPIKLIKIVRADIAKRFLQMHHKDFQEFSHDVHLLTAEDILKVFNACNASEAQFICRNIWKNIYAKEYQAKNASDLEKIIYMLTTTDIKSLDIESIRSCITVANYLAVDLRDNLLTICDIVDTVQKHATDPKVQTMLFQKIAHLNPNVCLNLQGMTNFSNLCLYDEFFPHAYLSCLSLTGADLRRCDFLDCVGDNSNFSNSLIISCDFARANLSCANFTGVKLFDCDFSGTNLRSAILVDARLESSVFELADLTNAIFIPKDAFNDLTRFARYLARLYSEVHEHQDEELLTTAIAENIISTCKKLYKNNKKDQALGIMEQATHHILFCETFTQGAQKKGMGLFDEKVRPAENAFNKLLKYQKSLAASIDKDSHLRISKKN